MTSRTNHDNPLHQHKQGIINSLKFFLLWTGGSVLAVSLGFILRIRAGLDGWLGLFFIMAIPYMLVIIIIQMSATPSPTATTPSFRARPATPQQTLPLRVR